jgi:hypothetical protein
MGDPPVVQISTAESRLLLSPSPECVRSNHVGRCLRISIAFLIIVFSPFSAYSQKSSGGHKSTYSTSAKRDSHGRIKRSSSAKEKFMKQTGYPHGRPGYVIDHIVPLANGGKDDPSNMQWQTKPDAKAKDKWERGQSSHSSVKKSVQPKTYKTRKGTTGSKRPSSHYSGRHR